MNTRASKKKQSFSDAVNLNKPRDLTNFNNDQAVIEAETAETKRRAEKDAKAAATAKEQAKADAQRAAELKAEAVAVVKEAEKNAASKKRVGRPRKNSEEKLKHRVVLLITDGEKKILEAKTQNGLIPDGTLLRHVVLKETSLLQP